MINCDRNARAAGAAPGTKNYNYMKFMCLVTYNKLNLRGFKKLVKKGFDVNYIGGVNGGMRGNIRGVAPITLLFTVGQLKRNEKIAIGKFMLEKGAMPDENTMMMAKMIGDPELNDLLQEKMNSRTPAQLKKIEQEKAKAALAKAKRAIEGGFGGMAMPFAIAGPGSNRVDKKVTMLLTAASPLERDIGPVAKSLEVSVDKGKTWLAWPTKASHSEANPALKPSQYQEVEDDNFLVSYEPRERALFGAKSWYKTVQLKGTYTDIRVRAKLTDGTDSGQRAVTLAPGRRR